MERKYGIDMSLPAGKLPGYYAQIVKDIAERASLFDRHEELIVFDSPDCLPAVEQWLERHHAGHERVDLVLLPKNGFAPESLFEDYAIVSGSGNVYLDLALVSFFRLREKKPDAESAPALLQLSEHLIADIASCDGVNAYAVDSQLTELVDRIAAAYGCEAQWLAMSSL